MNLNILRDVYKNPTLIRRATVALGVAVLVAGVLRVRGSGNTPPTRTGWTWTELDPSEYRVAEEPTETLAEVIPLHPSLDFVPTAPKERKVIDIDDVPRVSHPSTDLRLVAPLIDSVDVASFTKTES